MQFILFHKCAGYLSLIKVRNNKDFVLLFFILNNLVNEKPVNIKCVDVSTLGVAWQTMFTATCTAWQAYMSTPAELTYEYRVGYRHDNNTQIFYWGSTPVSLPVSFPQGNTSDSYLASVYAYITDSLLDQTINVVDIKVCICNLRLTGPDVIGSGCQSMHM